MSVMSAVVEVERLIVDMCSAVRCCTGRGLDSCLDICREISVEMSDVVQTFLVLLHSQEICL